MSDKKSIYYKFPESDKYLQFDPINKRSKMEDFFYYITNEMGECAPISSYISYIERKMLESKDDKMLIMDEIHSYWDKKYIDLNMLCNEHNYKVDYYLIHNNIYEPFSRFYCYKGLGGRRQAIVCYLRDRWIVPGKLEILDFDEIFDEIMSEVR